MRISEPFAKGNSFIHQLSPQHRVFWGILWALSTALMTHLISLFAVLLFSIGLVVIAKLDWEKVVHRLFVVFGFLFLIWLTLPFTFEGERLYQLGILSVYYPGVVLAAMVTLKTMSILLIFTALITTMPITTLGQALKRLRVPDKLVYLLLLTYRYLFVITEEYTRLRTAMLIRGFRPSLNIHSLKSYAYLMGMLFVRASVRAERVSQAMCLRGFNGEFHSLLESSFFRSSRPFNLFMLFLLGSVILIDRCLI